MKSSTAIIFVCCFLVFAGCKTKKAAHVTNASSAPSPSNQASVTGPTSPLLLAPLPGEAEHKAIQRDYPGTSLDQLKSGHAIYTGACAQCHEVKNIYAYSQSDWLPIFNDMAMRSRLSDAEKDALWKYLMACKTADPNRR